MADTLRSDSGIDVTCPEKLSDAETKVLLDNACCLISELNDTAYTCDISEKSESPRSPRWDDECKQVCLGKNSKKNPIYNEKNELAAAKKLAENSISSLQKSNENNSEKVDSVTAKGILKFLETVETADRKLSYSIPTFSDTDNEDTLNSSLLKSKLVSRNKTKHKATTSDATNEPQTSKPSIAAKNMAIKQLRRELSRQQELTCKYAKDAEHELKTRLKLQQEESERDIKRHLAFIDQLICDKKSLNEKCDSLLRQSKIQEKKMADRIKAAEDRHDIELKKMKDMQHAAEKIKRERWIEEKTKQIKEATIRGLEKEIQKLIAEHKAEIRKLKAIHKAEITETDERCSRRFVSEIEKLRDDHAKEKEQMLSHERDLTRQRIEALHNDMTKRIAADEEKHAKQVKEMEEKYEYQLQERSEQYFEMEGKLISNHEKEIYKIHEHYKCLLNEVNDKHELALKRAVEERNFENEKNIIELKKQQEREMFEKIKTSKEEMRKDRDREIEGVIERLEEDSAASKIELEKSCENRIRRLTDKYEREIVDLENHSKEQLNRATELKLCISKLENESIQLKVEREEKQQELIEVRKFVNRLTTERENLTEVIRKEFNDTIHIIENENRQLKLDIAEIRAKYKFQVDKVIDEKIEMQTTHGLELKQLQSKIQSIIERKDSTIEQLKSQCDAVERRADHLEQLLEQQRKQLSCSSRNKSKK